MTRSDDLSREMDLLKGLNKGELEIGVGTYVGVELVDRAIGRIVRRHPKVRLRIANDNWVNLLPLMRRRNLDMAVINVQAASPKKPKLHITPLQRRQRPSCRPARPSVAPAQRPTDPKGKSCAIPLSVHRVFPLDF